MPDPNAIYQHIIKLLEEAGAEFKVYEHRPILTYEDAELARQESGFVGTESKNMVLWNGTSFAVYMTTMGTRVDFKAAKQVLGGKKVRMATGEELQESFGALPGNAYPFGFDAAVPIYVDPVIFDQEWVLFSPAIPNATVQVRGDHLRRVFQRLPNDVHESNALNQAE